MPDQSNGAADFNATKIATTVTKHDEEFISVKSRLDLLEAKFGNNEKIADTLRKSTPESRYMGKAGWRGKSLYGGVNQELTFPVGLGLVVDGKKLPVKTVEIPAE